MLRGEAGVASAPKVRGDLEVIIAATRAHILVDCTQLRLIDFRVVGVLIDAYHDLAREGREMLVANVPAHCSNVFRVLGLDDLLRYDRTVA